MNGFATLDSIPEPFLDREGYAALGFLSGLEVHRQLLTSRKLFCRCPAGLYSDRCDAEILRHMRPTLSEMGEYDGTALMEFKTRKDILYQLDRRTVCTYEMDDTPPFPPDPEAIDIALEQCMLFGCSLVGEVHFMRKQYLDGSIPTGFQRTTILGVTGRMPLDDREVRIRQISLEEDSCREVSDHAHRRTYRTDRLGMPLTEIVTEPELFTPHECMAGARAVQALEHVTRIRRGIGTARMDVNVSVRGGTRVEIKGVPRIPLIPRLTHFEAVRQARLLTLMDRLRARTTEAAVDGARVVLRGFGGLLRFPLGPGRTFLDEIKDRVRVIACIVPDLSLRIETDDDRVGDAVIRVDAPEPDATTARAEIAARAREALDGVPAETRQHRRDGTTRFERILPGPDRMYPDTDMPPIGLAPARLERLRAGLPEPTWERVRYARGRGVHFGQARLVAASPYWPDFREAVEAGIAGSRAASLLVDTARRLARRGHELNGVPWLAILKRGLQRKDEAAAVLDAR